MDTDPFTLVYNALWEAVDSSTILTELVRQGNKIKFIKELADHDPRKVSGLSGQAPELMLIPDSFDTNFDSTNTGTGIQKIYNFVIRTTDRLLNKSLFPVEWALYLALINGRKEISKVTYKQKTFVTNVRILQAEAKLPEQNSSIAGWRCVWVVEVSMEFDKNVLT